MDRETMSQTLKDIYIMLMDRYGPQNWWPASEPFEVMVGAILTQSTAWLNVEKAIANLKAYKALSPKALRHLSLPEIANLIHPCGYFNTKAFKLKSLAYWLGRNYNDDLNNLFAEDINILRQQLLTVWGIGQETADSIILYAASKPIFVVDAYTRRIFNRIGFALEGTSYSAHQGFFMSNLPSEVSLFNEYHALIVCLAKDVCRSRPLCIQCCLTNLCCYYLLSINTTKR